MKRDIITIDEEKCNGCGLCITGCPEGALQLIDGKARLVSDLFCDGLGACIGECPEGAIFIEKREAELYDEVKVMENIVKCGDNTIKAHLKHLKDHNEDVYYSQAVKFLNDKGIKIKEDDKEMSACNTKSSGCPGSKMRDFGKSEVKDSENGKRASHLRQWPVQLHLISPLAPYFNKEDVLLAADCTAFSVGDFHKDFLQGKKLIIACPKLDQGIDIYIQKIKSLIDDSLINTLTVMIMEVPCCHGLLKIAVEAASNASRKIPVKKIKIGIEGNVLEEGWVDF